MALTDRIIITSNEYEKENFKEFLTDIIEKGVQRGYGNLSSEFKIDVAAINQRIDDLDKWNRKKLKFQLLTSSILIGIVLFKSRDPLNILLQIVKSLMGFN